MTHDVCGVNLQTRGETLDLFLAPKMAKDGLIATALTAWLKPGPPDAT
jgi:hypothetical protein